MKTRTLAMLLCTLALAAHGAEDTKPAPDGAKKPGGPGGPGGKGDGSFFRNMDKDGDKAISQAEAGERWQGLGKLDKDSDGKVTMQELMAGRPGGPNGPGAGPGKPEGGPGKPEGNAGRGEFFKNADKNSDGKISKDEVPAEAWERLGKLDKDSDNAVSKEEMAAMMAGRGGPGGPGGPGGGNGAPGEFFAKADKNGDGKITKDEAPAEAWERMSKADKNNDGALTKEELAGALAGRGGPGGPGGRPGGPGFGGPQGGPGSMFSRYDADKDGKLSKTEVPAEMWDKLSKADENADGLVSEKELEGAYRRPDGGPGKPGEKRPEGAAAASA